MDNGKAREDKGPSKKRKLAVQYARCPHCWNRVEVPDDKDPDRMVEAHARNDCSWVSKHGFFLHPSMRIEATEKS